MTQYGFFFDQSRCTGCRTCTISCKDWYDVPPGPAKWLKVYEYEKGSFPDLRIHFQWVPCFHCENPVCVDACPFEALYKEATYGAVLVDEEKCQGSRLCWQACPYGAIAYESDEWGAKAQKCTMCIDRLEQGMQPSCVESCPMRALDFGPLAELQAKYGDLRDLEDLPSSATTLPAVVLKPHDEKVQLVSYDADKALELLQYRWPLPPIFESKEDVTDVPEGLVGRDKLVIKPKDSEDLQFYTQDDRG